jgi:signal peptidase
MAGIPARPWGPKACGASAGKIFIPRIATLYGIIIAREPIPLSGALDELKKFLGSHPGLYQFMKDIAFSLAVVAVIALALYAYAGTWPPVVSVNGYSMLPNMHGGDLVLVQGMGRADVMTYEESVATEYRQYSDYGDVIVYNPYGDRTKPMVIHRAIRWVNKSEPMWPGGPAAPESGYVTRGDNNNGVVDQASNICYLQPVRPEWVHGVSRFKVPYLGYLRSLI